jgi:hypothetical protein
MDDIKQAFIEVAINSMDEERMSYNDKRDIAEVRWQKFVNHLVADGPGLNYANGNWWK